MSIFCCPVCGRALTKQEHALRCEIGHSFDLARKGYVNLLRSNQSHNKRHGDDRAMVAARTAFLDAGYYSPLCRAIAKAAAVTEQNGPVVLDAGCGEGYYTAAVHEALKAAGKSPVICGVDISREALIAAHRRDPALQLAVASLADLPLADGCCDVILHVFAPLETAEFRRVLRPGGRLIRAVPLEDHLWSLKCAVYDRPYRNPPPETTLPGFRLVDRQDLISEITLPSQSDIHALFMMTPYYYKTSRTDQEKLAGLSELKTETAFGLLIYETE